MTRELIAATAIGLVVLIATLIFFSNRSLRRAQEADLPRPEDAVALSDGVAGYYVSTVFADSPLRRVWAWGLGGRGKALIGASSAGISIERQGESGLFIPAADFIGAGRVSATIDKGVERDGLLVLNWQLGKEQLATHLRIVSKAERKQFEMQLKETLGVEIG